MLSGIRSVTHSEILQIFAGVRVARQGDRYAPHKPLVLLLLLEKILNGHENRFSYSELDAGLRRLLDKFGSDSASAARNEPFWRLRNDGILYLTAPISLLQLATTPTPSQLIEGHAIASFDAEVYGALRNSTELVLEIAEQLAEQYLGLAQRRAIIADAAPSIARLQRKFWWVSQNKTYRDEIDGNFMWSPKTNADGTRNPNYDLKLARFRGHFPLGGEGSTNGQKTPPVLSAGLSAESRRAGPIGSHARRPRCGVWPCSANGPQLDQAA